MSGFTPEQETRVREIVRDELLAVRPAVLLAKKVRRALRSLAR